MHRPILIALALVAALMPAHARPVITTQQSLTYEVPEGWTFHRWDENTGEAVIKNDARGNMMTVARYPMRPELPSYTNSEKFGDRTFAWNAQNSPMSKTDLWLLAKITFEGANADTWIGLMGNTAPGADLESDLAAMRAIVKTLQITGPSKCPSEGKCPPGEVKTDK